MIDHEKQSLAQKKVIYDLEMYLRTFIIEHDIWEDRLAKLMNILPVGVEVFWAKHWSIKDCMEMAKALGLVIHFEVKPL